ncbi:DUF3592 domain-containing protein [Planomonospora sp. ID67723]|uniref:DUF3592 domain-containing protein n=1 Tax=Planomonospora sp. ID67723 TaxID=2738134 RepID=UPI0018C3A71B|nr:DUF3592 domain-containing protein [Planomonospora sp. ID67723]MBG0827017.1 DUF3592 domain-containing protein [Planomonospora sp. ID67723]
MTVFEVLTAVFLGAVGLVVLLGCFLMGFAVIAGIRRRRVVRVGERTTARCIRSHRPAHPASTRSSGPPRSRQRFVLEFRGPDGGLVRFEDDSTPATTREGDELTVAYLPARPERAVVVIGDEQTNWAEPVQMLAAFCVFLIVMAGIAFIGVEVLRDYASAASDPGFWIEP